MTCEIELQAFLGGFLWGFLEVGLLIRTQSQLEQGTYVNISFRVLLQVFHLIEAVTMTRSSQHIDRL